MQKKAISDLNLKLVCNVSFRCDIQSHAARITHKYFATLKTMVRVFVTRLHFLPIPVCH